MGYVAARTSRHKYINYRELQGMDELYDLEKDPYEETNIIDRPDAHQTLQQMQAELRRLLEQTQVRSSSVSRERGTPVGVERSAIVDRPSARLRRRTSGSEAARSISWSLLAQVRDMP